MSDHFNSNESLTQFSTVNGLLVGLYDGMFSVEEVLARGNFGLGCPHAMEGEMLIHEHECFVAPANVPPRKMAKTETVAFAQVADFNPTIKLEVGNGVNKGLLAEILLESAATKNLFIGFRAVGKFTDLTIRQPPVDLEPPYPPMIEVLKTQTKLTYPEAEGTLLGFWTPSQYQGLSVAGIHMHFLQGDEVIGGHVMDLNIQSAILEIQVYNNFNLILPRSQKFLHKDMDYENMDAHIKEAEG